ncbi:GTPase [Iningainema tapete]|uniref:DUF3482 domain-containing protein n=1 Tax=Iningainema tapete BLCC-T55 TaxID=2748662 RepID=A0A8J7BVW0_9CYAN|nr:GTPase [Iningainema tapete]MBD2770642.1 DUF3482 domain-containing protein [Iningainema tapete BLCC-T55]
MFNSNDSRIVIALAGHTGVGKTTLISTLRKAPSGEIGNMGNTTKKAESYNFPEYKSLHATFVDCPGFQNAVAMFDYLDAKQEGIINKFLAKFQKRNINVEYDIRAVEALKSSDVVLYVGNLINPADDSHTNEVKVIQQIQRRVIVILNKAGEFEDSHGRTEKDKRINQWKNELIQKAGIEPENIIDFDSHFDNPSKVQEIYNAILRILPPKRGEVFKEGLKEFEKRQHEIEQEAYKLLAREVISIRNKTLKQKINDNSRGTAKRELEKEIENLLNYHVLSFIQKASQLYEIGAKNPTMSVNQFLKKARENIEKPTARQRMTDAALGGSIGGVAVSAAYAGLFAAATFFTGGAAIPALIAAAGTGAAYGAGIGTIGGSIIGAAAAKGDNVYKINLDAEVTEYLAEICIALIYGLSHYGYGAFYSTNMRDKEKEIPVTKSNELRNKVQQINKNRKHKLNWITATELQIINWCEETLRQLEA